MEEFQQQDVFYPYNDLVMEEDMLKNMETFNLYKQNMEKEEATSYEKSWVSKYFLINSFITGSNEERIFDGEMKNVIEYIWENNLYPFMKKLLVLLENKNHFMNKFFEDLFPSVEELDSFNLTDSFKEVILIILCLKQ